jgi:predicted RNA-binding protein with RPS1 domain
MGGGSSREKRKLKRLQAENKTAPSATSSQPGNYQSPANNKSANLETKVAKTINGKSLTDQSNTSNAVQRLRRKLERKASGKYKLASVDKSPPKIQEKKISAKRRQSEGNNSGTKRPRMNGAHQTSQKSPAHQTSVKKTIKKRTDNAKKKPKHLNRKVTQLSKSLAGGGNIEQLEEQMNQLKEQIEMMKSMKGGVSDGAVKETADKVENTGSSSSSSSSSNSVASTSNDKTEPAVSKDKADSSSSSGSSSSSDDSDDEVVEDITRSRGKKRRGRREKVDVVNDDKSNGDIVEAEYKDNDANEAEVANEETATPSKKKSKKDDTRRCIGRKPVTDYKVGQKYQGKVKYIKSTLGAFIDIGSHSDAFCHISCISDGYAATVEQVVNVGDEVEVRVIEVNREKKRITVSLRSDEMAQLEVDQLQSKQKKMTPKNDKKSGDKKEKSSGHTRFGNDSKEEVKAEKENDSANLDAKKWEGAASKTVGSSGVKTGTDLKRERKLARRAERRAQQLAG